MARTNPAFFHFFARTGTDVHVKLVYFRNLFVILFPEVHRGISDHPEHWSFAAQDLDSFPPGDCSIAPTDTSEVDETFVRDVLNHKADFVRVGFQHDGKRLLFSL
jgi:hypothetical protein